MRRCVVVISLLASVFPIAVWAVAEDLKIKMPDTVITATRTATRPEDVTTPTTVIDGEEIQARDQIFSADALRGAPGLDLIEFGSPGQSSFVSLRGAAPDQVLVLVDGVEVNAPTTGQFDFGNFLTHDLDRIEILRSGGGALYGSQAIGGVVNLLTHRGEGPFRYSLLSEAGSGKTHRETAGLSGSSGPFALSGAFSFLDSDGFRPFNDDYRNLSTAWRGDADVLPNATLSGFLRYTNARTGLPHFNIIEGRLDRDARSRSDFFLGKGEWRHALTDALSYRVSTSIVRDNQRYRDDELEDDDEAEEDATQAVQRVQEEEGGKQKPEILVRAHFPNEIFTAETQWDYRFRDMSLTTVGFEFKERSAHIFKSQPEEEEDDEEEREVERFNANRSNVAVYLQEQLWGFEDTLRGVGGLRYDHYDRFGDEVTLSGSGAYLFQPTWTRFHVGYAEGFRVPTFNELFEPALGNPRLRPEHSWEINAGIIQEIPHTPMRFEATYFYRKVKNLIEEVADQLPGAIRIPEDSEGEPLTRNLNARLQGVELIGLAQPTSWLTLSGTYMYLDFSTPTGALLNRPHHRGSFSASCAQSELFTSGDHGSASLLVYAVGKRDSADPHDDFEVEKAPGYVRTDIAFAYRFGGALSRLKLHGAVRNLFDRDYAESLGFRAPPLRFLLGLSYELG
jgi:vitamin B12 transporter